MPEVEITVARPEEKSVLANLMQLYVHDFTEQWSDQERGELQDDGLFPEYPLDAYWREPDHIPLIFRVGGHLAGFALLNASSHSGRPVERNMAEFFVVRKHRRGGTGSVAARTIFSRYPGLWEAAVARRNVGALAFWRKVIRHHPLVADVEETDVSTDQWDGPIFRFRIGPPDEAASSDRN